VRGNGGDVRVTGTTEDTKMIIVRRVPKSTVRGGSWGGSRRKTVEQVCGGVKTLRPKARGREAWIRSVRMISFVVRIICSALPWTRHAQLNTTREKGAGGVVIELTPIVTLDNLDGEAELSRHPSKEVEGWGKSQT
jgi:hypothetical protein